MLGFVPIRWLIILSVFTSTIGVYAYVRDTLRGKTKPNRVTWSMWAIAPLIGTAAALGSGADIWVTIPVFMAGFLPLLVLLASLVNPQSYWQLTSFDLSCGGLSLAALLVWSLIDSPRLAIVLAAVGDGCATLPTLFKAWTFPETETGLTYLAGVISMIFVIPSIPEWNIENAAFQIYLLASNCLLLTAVYRKQLRTRF